jgi:hypothetical protein
MTLYERAASDGLSEPERRQFRICLAISALFFLTASIFSVGSYNPDEYFQVVEFASTKLGLSNPADLPWEYANEMRGWLQPAIYVAVARLAEFVGIYRPLTLLFLFRLVTAIVVWSAVWSLIAVGRRWLEREEDRRLLYWVTALLWLLPFMAPRTSGETMSAAMVCFGVAALQCRLRLRTGPGLFGLSVLAGLAFGLCFEFRYPSVFMAAGAALWYLWVGPARILLLIALAIGSLLAVGAGCLADWWGYGHLTFPAYWYVYQNFFMGRAEALGTAPFFAYLYLPVTSGGTVTPLLFTIVIATLTAWIRRPRSAVTWTTAPYVAILSIVGHKETRFLFPLIPFAPFFIVEAFTFAIGSNSTGRIVAFLRWLATGYRLKIAYVFNAIGLLGVLFLPQWGRAPIYQRIEDEAFATKGPLDAVVIHTLYPSPYAYTDLHASFLEPKNIRWSINPPLADLEARQSRGDKFLAAIDIPVGSRQTADWVKANCTLLSSVYPPWLEPYNFSGWQQRSYWWELYRCGG